MEDLAGGTSGGRKIWRKDDLEKGSREIIIMDSIGKTGLVHIYYGDGKGKTTCAMGLCLRAAGAGRRVLIYQFMKDGSGNECRLLEAFQNVGIATPKRPVRFSFRMDAEEREKEREYYRIEFERIKEWVHRDPADVLFLDEALYAVSGGFLREEELTDFLDHRPDGLEVILTGGEASDAVKRRADYISRICKEKHPYDSGIAAREGIEW